MIFNLFNRKSAIQPEAGQTKMIEMSLQERMAFRRELTYKAIREVLSNMEVLNSMYRLRIQQVDERGHRYIALIDTADSFQVGQRARAKTLMDIEKLIKDYAFDRYNVGIAGIYWRSNTEKIFERQRRASDPIDREIVEFQRSRASKSLSRVDELIPNDEETKAFFEALKQGKQHKPLQVNGRAYDTDLAPLS